MALIVHILFHVNATLSIVGATAAATGPRRMPTADRMDEIPGCNA